MQVKILSDALAAQYVARKPSNMYLGFRCFATDVLMHFCYDKSLEATRAPDFEAEIVLALDNMVPILSLCKYSSIFVFLVHHFPAWLAKNVGSSVLAAVFRLREVRPFPSSKYAVDDVRTSMSAALICVATYSTSISFSPRRSMPSSATRRSLLSLPTQSSTMPFSLLRLTRAARCRRARASWTKLASFSAQAQTRPASRLPLPRITYSTTRQLSSASGRSSVLRGLCWKTSRDTRPWKSCPTWYVTGKVRSPSRLRCGGCRSKLMEPPDRRDQGGPPYVSQHDRPPACRAPGGRRHIRLVHSRWGK
jgi:hypothetical protein